MDSDKTVGNIKTVLIFVVPILLLLLMLLLVNATSPVTAGPVGILALFVLFYALIASVLHVLILAVVAIWRLFGESKTVNRRIAVSLSCVLAIAPVFLIALNTLGRIGFVEIVLITVLVALASFYVFRRSNNTIDT